jgi:rsbT co-antagonist protein RsbR
MTTDHQNLLLLLDQKEDEVVSEWLQEAGASSSRVSDGARRAMQVEARELLQAVRGAVRAEADLDSFDGPEWAPVRQSLEGLSRTRAAQGQSAGDTSAFVLAMKKPLFSALPREKGIAPERQLPVAWAVSRLADRLAQWTATTYQQTREELIQRQQQDLLELSTPVIKLWEGVLAVPMIGTLDSSRTQVVMESLLQRIVDTGATLAIIDITGVPTVDTLVAQHLLKTVSAIRLMGADCIISGIRPQIAQTIVHLGIDLQGIASKSSLADALALALQRQGLVVTRKAQ